jgi:S1-C subfamily serine protease
MDLVVDGRRGVAYVRPKKTTPPTYAHNCLGAVFVPPDLLHPETGNLAARVLEGSPAYEAGIRNGDILLKLGDNETIKPGINQIRLHEQFMAPTNGTKLALTLRRGTETFVVTPMLRQILKPAVGGR